MAQDGLWLELQPTEEGEQGLIRSEDNLSTAVHLPKPFFIH
jgi:hypothetical protein